MFGSEGEDAHFRISTQEETALNRILLRVHRDDENVGAGLRDGIGKVFLLADFSNQLDVRLISDGGDYEFPY